MAASILLSWPGEQLQTTIINGRPAQYFVAPGPAPLIVNLHQWSGDETTDSGTDERFDHAVMREGWHFIRPRIGPNNSPEGCCSDALVPTINAGVEYIRSHANVTSVFVVGASGGGYATLCAFMRGIDATFIAWVPISDLEAWHDYHRNGQYGRDVRQCTGSGDKLNVAEARRRSPLYMTPNKVGRLHIFHGIHDTSVPVEHTKRFSERHAASVTLFDGGHEFHVAETIELIKSSHALRPSAAAR